jgi:glutathione synthase/RimK-type ligase-like ATP-grasp enzyme
MRKILILVDKIGAKKELFAEEVAKRLGKDIQLFMAKFSDLYLEIDGKKLNIKIQEFPITDFDLVYFRRTGEKFSVLASTLAICLETKGIKFIDSAWKNIGPLGSKFTSLIKLSQAGLPIFPTIFVWPANINNFSDEIIEKLGLPLVAKELSMQRGKGVFLIKSKEDFDKLPMQDSRGGNNQFLFQKYFKLKNEYRVLVLGNKAAVWEKKIITKEGEFRHNIALGAKEQFLPIKKIPQEISRIAVKGARVLGLEIAGVDIATEKGTKKIFLVEVNRGPGITYDTKISPELEEIAKFLGKKIR